MLFSNLAVTYSKLEATTSKKGLISILASLFENSTKEEIGKVVYLIRGKIGPDYETLDFGIGEKMMEQSIIECSGRSLAEVRSRYKSLGDLGLVAETFLKERARKRIIRLEDMSSGLEVSEVFEELKKIAKVSGEGSQDKKIKMMGRLISRLSPLEARYVVRIPLGRLRLGVGEPTIMDALSVVVVGDVSGRRAIERAYNVCSDLGLVASVLFRDGLEGLENIRIEPGKPVKPALAMRAASVEEILDRLGRCAVEGKYDGFRCQVHVIENDVKIFSRNMEETTSMFPDLVEGVKKQISAKSAILDAEAISYDAVLEHFSPFQITMRRKRKYGIEEAKLAHPLKLFVFDLLYVNGKEIVMERNEERFRILERIYKEDEVVKLVDRIVTGDKDEFRKWFELMVSRGLEGVIAKDLDAPYTLGERKYSWIKLKRSYRGKLEDTIDVVIVGYLKGRGRRVRQGLGAILTAVYNDEKDTFDTVGKVGSGLTEKGMAELREELDRIAVDEKPVRVNSKTEPDVWVEPMYVITVIADEITKSPNYTAGAEDGETGYSLRFPRVIGYIREDKNAEDATTVKEILDLYKMQKRAKLK